jgi:hypothetical protein
MATLENLLVLEAELQLQVQALKSSLADARVRIADMRGVNRNAVTYNLPNELLSSIFEIGLSRSPFLSTKPTRGGLFEDKWSPLPTPFEIVVSSVSRRWRNVALQTPQLWTQVYINVAQLTHDLLDLYLCRSKMCLLDITLSRRKLQWERDYDLAERDATVIIECKRYLEQLIPHVRRWREFSMKQDDCFVSLSDALADLAHLYAPALETLLLDGGPGSLMNLFSAGAPRLSYVELTGVRFFPPLQAVKYLKFHLHHFPLSHAQFRELIQPMRSLIRLNLESGIVKESPEGHPPIHLPSVIDLEIDICSSHVGEGVLSVLDLPSVETLTIRGHTDHVIKTFANNTRLYRSVRSLRVVGPSIYFQGADTPVGPTLQFICLFPNVQDVAFHGGDPRPIIQALYDRRSIHDLLWPQLSSVIVVPSAIAKVLYEKRVWADMVKLVGNRLQLGLPISSVKLPVEIVERGTQRQQQRLREQVVLIEC